jgi:hypothetical protein
MLRRHGFIVCLLCLGAVAAAHGGEQLPKYRRNGAEAYYADLDLRAALDKTSRAALPEVRRKNPKITDQTFLWTKLLPRDFVLRQADSAICWAFAGVTALEYNWVIRNGGRTPLLAVQPILDRTGKWGGAPLSLALQDLLDHGTCLAKNYPHVGNPDKLRTKAPMRYRAIAWGRVIGGDGGEPTVEQIKQTLVDHGPLVASINLTPAFKAYKGGVFRDDSPLPDPPSGHAVVIVGWDDSKAKAGCWRIENSWGEKWGELGFMWLAYGSNQIGREVYWIHSQAAQYQLPSDIHKRVSADTDPFPKWPNARKATAKPADLPVLSVSEALGRQGDRVVVQFRPRGGGIGDRDHVELYSEKSWQDERNLTVRILKSEQDKSTAKNDRELVSRYLGKEIRVRGSVQPNWIRIDKKPANRPMIEVGDPDQIEIVNK